MGVPAVHVKSEAQFASLKVSRCQLPREFDAPQTKDVVAFGVFAEASGEAFETFRAVANKNSFTTAYFTAEFPVPGVPELEAPALFLTKDDGEVLYSGEWQEEALLHFLATESTPLVLDFGNKVFESPVKKHIVLFARAVGRAECCGACMMACRAAMTRRR